MNRIIIITGASGFTGMHACQYFANKGYQVIGISRTPVKGVKWVVESCDLADKQKVVDVMKKYQPDFCLHLAGANSVPHSWKYPVSTIETNFLGTLYLLEAIRMINPLCKTVVVGSALSGTDHPYGVSKLYQQNVALDWARLFELSVIVAKPCNLIGPGRSSGFVSYLANVITKMEKMDKDDSIVVSNLRNEREFLDVRDAINAYEVLLMKGLDYAIYEIGSGKMTTLLEVAECFQSLTSIKLTFEENSSIPDNKPALMNADPIKQYNWNRDYPIEVSIEQTLSYYRSLNDE